MEQKISIPPISEKINNIYGYIDTGFTLVLSDMQAAYHIFDKVDLKYVAKKMTAKSEHFNLAYVGNSIVFTPGGLTANNGEMPAHTNNFLEIMADGCARMRILLLNSNQDDYTVNMLNAIILLSMLWVIYFQIRLHMQKNMNY